MSLMIVMFFLLFSNLSKAQGVDYKAYSLYVYNFMKYVEWPEQDAHDDFVICVLGKSKIEKELSSLSQQKKIKNKSIKVKTCKTVEEIGDCHLLYVADDKSSLIKDVGAKLKSKNVLIVGEREGLANRGASLSFVILDNDELSFDINKKIINYHKLKIAGSLVKLGTVVAE